ncbi:MAG: aminodeoxychorismate lyase [Turicibacter sp.]|nr:aminodeoxychorismate lyase [Turicibacter sp.]
MMIYLNGDYIEEADAVISPFDHGFLYGVGLFETFPIHGEQPFLLTKHLDRLRASLKDLAINWAHTEESIREILDNLLRLNGLEDAYVRLNVSGGAAPVGLPAEGYASPTTIIFMKPLASQIPVPEKSGVILDTPRNTPEGPYRMKSHHFLNNILAKAEIGPKTEIEGIFLTQDGFLAEGIVSNLFFARDGILHTPDLGTGILNGITRQYLLKRANEAGIPCVEGFFTASDLLAADEAFVTNSIFGIASLKSVEGHAYHSREIAKRLIKFLP